MSFKIHLPMWPHWLVTLSVDAAGSDLGAILTSALLVIGLAEDHHHALHHIQMALASCSDPGLNPQYHRK